MDQVCHECQHFGNPGGEAREGDGRALRTMLVYVYAYIYIYIDIIIYDHDALIHEHHEMNGV